MKVREAIREFERDGWYLDRQVGSHRQYRHPTQTGTVTVPGNLSDDVAAGTLGFYQAPSRTAEGSMMRYAVVIEHAGGNLSSYVPDLPGCVSTGATIDEVTANMAEAIAWHVKSFRDHGEPVPPPSSTTRLEL